MPSTRIEDYDPQTLTFHANFEDFEGIRHPEDGEYMIDSVYFVVATAPNGVRWKRQVGAALWDSAMGRDVDGWDDPYVYQNEDPKELGRKANTLATKLTNSTTRRLNPDVWNWSGCVYGSTAYEQLDMEAELCEWEQNSEVERF